MFHGPQEAGLAFRPGEARVFRLRSPGRFHSEGPVFVLNNTFRHIKTFHTPPHLSRGFLFLVSRASGL